MNQSSRSGKLESPTPPNTAEKRPVAFLLPNLKGGGTQRAQLLIAQGASDLGESVDLVVCRRVGSFSENLPPGIRLVDLKGRFDVSPLSPLVRYLRREKPRAIYSALNQANVLALISVYLAKTDTKVVMSVHNHFGAKWEYNRTPTAPFRKLLFRWIYFRADQVVTVSDNLRNYLIERLHLPPDQVVAITNPVDLAAIQTLGNQPVEHPWLADRHPIPVIIAIGRLDHQKDFATLIKAFREVLNKKETRLLILGEGPKRKELENLIQQLQLTAHVQLAGFQANPYAWMARSDLFVLSSLWEGYPLVLLEALAFGLPLVSTDCRSGPKEMKERFPSIRLVPIRNPHAMADAVISQLANRPSSDCHHKQVHQTLEADFSQIAIWQRYRSAAQGPSTSC